MYLNRKWVRILLLLLPVIFVITCVLLQDTALWIAENALPECVSFAELGIYCPGCGLTRCILAVMNGDLWLAFRNNAAVTVLFICIVLLYAEMIMLSFGKDVHLLPRKAWIWILLGIAAGAYFVLRNFIPELQPLPLIA